MRAPVLLLLLLFLCGCLGNEYSGDEFSRAYSRFASSDYLNLKWRETCVFPLNASNTVVIAKMVETGNETYVECRWSMEAVGVNEVGVVLSQGQSDIDPAWIECGKTNEFSEKLRDAVHNPGSNIVHLNDGLGGKENATSFVYVGKCHFWDERYCRTAGSRFCRLQNAKDIISVAYAIMDDETGKIYW
jgi:hypothetical protein